MLKFHTNLLVTIATKVPPGGQKPSLSDEFKQETVAKNCGLVKTIQVELSRIYPKVNNPLRVAFRRIFNARNISSV